MPEFVFTYRMPNGFSGGGAEAFQIWSRWFEEMGQHVVDAGEPVVRNERLGEFGSDSKLVGYSLIRAESLEQALELAKGCPTLSAGGGVEIGERMKL